MEVHFGPELQAKLEQLAIDTSLAPDELLADAMTVYTAEHEEAREMLDRRYDDLKSAKVKPIPGDEVGLYFREKSAVAPGMKPGS